MRQSRALAAAERRRLDDCAVEPIRTPGFIQSHGVMLVLDTDATAVVMASANVARAFAASTPALVIGAALVSLIGMTAAASVRDLANRVPTASNPAGISLRGGHWDVIVHRSNELVLVELEPALPSDHSPAASIVFEAIHRLSGLRTVAELRTEVVRAVSVLSGFDRVMLYHFHADGHGEVVADEHAVGMEPYLGLHFPASDIPAQARELYLTKLSRSIVSTDRPPSAMLGDSAGDLDLSLAELRAVSPYHLQFMRNMGQESTLSFSLVRDGQLTGMITCAHRSERRLPFAVRAALEVLARQVALQLASIEEIARLKAESRVRELRSVLVRQFAETDDAVAGLLDGAVSLFEVLDGDGALCSIGGVTRSVGLAPAVDDFEHWLAGAREAPDGVIVSHALATDHAELAELSPDAAGLLVLPLGASDYLAVFRQEKIRTVQWLGDQSSSNRLDPLSPRLSFSSWTQSVSGTAPEWGKAEHEAAELGKDLEAALLQKAESRLAAVALRDALTGLPNRRSLHSHLSTQLNQQPHNSTALLFIDLDRFKLVNDSMGHDIGDALLVEVAARLAATARAHDTVARLGGDEFVLICSKTTQAQAQVVADRILAALRAPISLAGRTVVVSASIGIAMAVPGHTAAELIKLADISMYKAKADGGDRAWA